MAGEMTQSEVTREAFPPHFAIADEYGGEVKAFDWYQGPYVAIGPDVRVGAEPYAYAPRGLGIVRLWLCSEDGEAFTVYNEANEKQSGPFLALGDDASQAIDAAAQVLA